MPLKQGNGLEILSGETDFILEDCSEVLQECLNEALDCLQLAAHLDDLLQAAYTKFSSWQSRRFSLGRK